MNENRFQELKEKLCCWASGQEMHNTAGYLKRLSEEEKKRVVEEADLAMKYTVMLHSQDQDQRIAVPHRRNEEMWIQHYEEHPQWTYELNRHDFLYTLLYAAVLTGDKKYGGMLRWYIFDWMIKNPIVLSGTETTRPADTGLRCLNWCGLIRQMIADEIIDEEDTVVYFQNMAMQFAYLRRKYVGSNTISSLGIPQTVAVCGAYVWFRDFLPQDDGLEQWAWSELKLQLELQILEDGSHREDVDSCSGWTGAAYEAVLELCEKLLNDCQDAERSGVMLEEDAKAAAAEAEGWLADVVRRMRNRLWYTPGRAGVLNSGWEKAPLYLYSPESEKLVIRSDWSEKADYTWMGRSEGSCGLKPYVRQQDGIYYAEMYSASAGVEAGDLLQADRLMVLPGGIWIVGQKVLGLAAEKTPESGNMGPAADFESERQVWSIEGRSARIQVCCSNALERKEFEDQNLVILAPNDVEVKRAAVFQFGRPAPLAKHLVTALDVKFPSGEVWTVILWNGKMDQGSRMFLCHGTPVCGEVVVLRENHGKKERVLLKN